MRVASLLPGATEIDAAVRTLTDEGSIYALDDAARIGEAIGRGEETRVKITALEERLDYVKDKVANLSRPRRAHRVARQVTGCPRWCASRAGRRSSPALAKLLHV